jgi:15-cis-phytoene synthase
MICSRDATEASYAFCRQVSRRAGSSFHAGFRLLPREKRRAMEALYAFMRHTDDLADEAEGGRGKDTADSRLRALQSPDDQIAKSANSSRELLAAWRAALVQALADDLPPSPFRLPPSSFPLPPSALPLPPLLPALADTVCRFQIPHEHLSAVIDGVEMDVAGQRYETFEELERYCERVASAVGLACIHIWGFRGPEAFEPARQVGIALQLTNILRDLKEDAAAGRVYLPLADLQSCGYSLDDLQAGIANDSFRRLMQFEIDRAKLFYRGGAELWNWLEPDGRRIFGLMTTTYWRLLERIERRPADVLRRRVRLGFFTKIGLFARWTLAPQDSLGIVESR